jgi:hypothetical protein
MPGVDICEFDLWREMAIEAAEEGRTYFVDRTEFDLARRELDCSEIVQAAISIPQQETTVAAALN